MAHVTIDQTRKLGLHVLSRNGLPVPGAAAMGPAACWNFALSGTVLGMADPLSPAEIYEGANGILDINNTVWPIVVNGLQATAIVANHPGCVAELATLNLHILNAIGGNIPAQNACQEALLGITARKNGLTPGADDRYKIHMKATTWYGWDHWALSLRPTQPGPRIYLQTTTGTPLKHACTTIWDEHLTGVDINIDSLHQDQVNYINLVNNVCVVCGARHWWTPSTPFNAWHRCTTCETVYCPGHGRALAGNRGWSDRTRNCGQPGCRGRTTIYSW